MNEKREIKKKRGNFINRFLILSVLMIICLNGCSQTKVSKQENTPTKSMFIVIETTGIWGVVYHRDTKVMYAVSYDMYNSGTFTLLVNADGSPMIWEDE